MSTATTETAGFIRQMVKTESSGWGDEAQALRRIARDCKASFWTLNNLRIGRAKTVNADLRDRVRQYFIDHCRSHAARLLRDAQMAAATETKNDDLRILQDEIRALAARLEAASRQKEGMK